MITVNSNSTSPVVIALAGNGAQASPHSVALTWDPNTDTADVVGYYVYRALPDGTYAKINAAPDANTQYTDTNLQSGQTYTYVVTVVDADNVESDYSDPVVVAIP
jgi:fibronectin type 3 domain-containing protein